MTRTAPILHGTHSGYVRGCRDECCARAHNRYMKLYRMGRQPRLIDATGTRRRLQALMALGHTAATIDEAAGKGKNWSHMLARKPRVRSSNAAVVAAIYERLCMVVPDHDHAPRLRTLASQRGYLPPLAWDDIDDPNERPRPSRAVDFTIPDPVVVERILGGDFKVPATRPDRVEVVRRWAAAGRSLSELARVTGWKPERYYRVRDHTGEAA